MRRRFSAVIGLGGLILGVFNSILSGQSDGQVAAPRRQPTIGAPGVAAPPPARQPRQPSPDRFLIGRRTFFDFGPPFDFYEVFSVRSTSGGALVERVMVAPPGDACTQAPTVEAAATSINESISDLLGRTDPCTIPEKDLRREIKRCRHCLVFSGADVVMQVQCGGNNRLIRMDILDRDMFDPHPMTPEHTSWTMGLLGRLDKVLGTSVMDRPIFALSETPQATPAWKSDGLMGELARGELDALFDKATDKPSELFRQAQDPPPGPSMELLSSLPYRPTSYALPTYPPIARVAHVSGQVTFTVDVAADGSASNLKVLSGHALLRGVVQAAAAGWRFPSEAAGQEIRATIEFKTNCPAAKR